MFSKNVSGNKINDLRNDYGWDRNDLQKMLDEQDYASIGIVAAWIRECGNGCHGFMVEDDPYIYPLDDDGNYTESGLAGC